MTKAKQEASELAEELIELYAQRKLQKAFSFKPNLKKEKEFKDSFSYIHTIDQSQAIGDILEDMEKETPMDRLLI
jgi:transcription-repair coupling factor (superfamily II helicase)